MLFLQGTQDALANTDLLEELTICAFGRHKQAPFSMARDW